MPLTKAEISRLRSLQEKKHRAALGLFVVEGAKVVGELLAADFPFVEIYATEEWADIADVGGVPSPRELTVSPPTPRGVRAPRPQNDTLRTFYVVSCFWPFLIRVHSRNSRAASKSIHQ